MSRNESIFPFSSSSSTSKTNPGCRFIKQSTRDFSCSVSNRLTRPLVATSRSWISILSLSSASLSSVFYSAQWTAQRSYLILCVMMSCVLCYHANRIHRRTGPFKSGGAKLNLPDFFQFCPTFFTVSSSTYMKFSRLSFGIYFSPFVLETKESILYKKGWF